jgi:multidrug efflux pump subunit AcrA (membrane-fusion protein)
VFGGWGYFAPLDGGAVAPGVINPDSGKKTIQHLEGGIIAEMRVREGETVTIGQPLVVLESTQARAAHAAPTTMASLWWAYRDLTCRKVRAGRGTFLPNAAN